MKNKIKSIQIVLVFSIAILTIYFSSCKLGNIKIDGTITYACSNLPVANKTISLTEAGAFSTSVSGTTDGNGYFKISAPRAADGAGVYT